MCAKFGSKLAVKIKINKREIKMCCLRRYLPKYHKFLRNPDQHTKKPKSTQQTGENKSSSPTTTCANEADTQKD